MVSKVLKAQRVVTSQDLLEHYKTDSDSLGSVIISDKTLVFEYDPKSKDQSSTLIVFFYQKKTRLSKLQVKVMLILF